MSDSVFIYQVMQPWQTDFCKKSLNPVRRLGVEKSPTWATAKPSRERSCPPPPFVWWSKGLLGKPSSEQFSCPCTLYLSLQQRVLGKLCSLLTRLGLLDPGFPLGEALWSHYSDCLNPCHTLLACQWVGAEEVETGKERLDISISGLRFVGWPHKTLITALMPSGHTLSLSGFT